MKVFRRVMVILALSCFILAVTLTAVCFFSGSSPSVISAHGNLTEYMARLSYNADRLLTAGRTLAEPILTLLQSL